LDVSLSLQARMILGGVLFNFNSDVR